MAHFLFPNRKAFAMKQLFCLLLLLFSTAGHAAISLSQTRVIYNADDKAAAVEVKNNTDTPYMVQTWLDTGDESSAPKNIPMLVTPPILKLDGQKSAMLRLIYQGVGLPQDVETVYWINVQEIPQTSEDNNNLQLAQRIRIKLFYRPDNLGVTPDEAAEKLVWQCQNNTLTVNNNSPLHVSLVSVSSGSTDIEADMVNPHASEHFPLPKGWHSGKIKYSWINDYGGTSSTESRAVSCH